MKKVILAILVSGIFILGLTGCSKSNKKIATDTGVTLTIKKNTLTKTNATLILTNDSNKVLKYNEEYTIEKRLNKEWHTMEADFFVNEPLWELKPHETKEIELNWENSYGKLAKGKYRIIKEVYFENEADKKFYIAKEFTIK